MSLVLVQIYHALALAAVYGLVGVGITLVYGLTRIVNFVQGQLIVLGGFATYALVQAGLPLGLALLGATLVTAGVSEATDLTLFRRTLHAPMVGFIVSLGLIEVFEGAFVALWGLDQRSLPEFARGSWSVSGSVFDQESLVVIAVSVAVMAVVWLLLTKSRVGLGIRALAEDGLAARSLGVPVGLLISVVFLLGSGLAGLAGGLLGGMFPFSALSGSSFLLEGFAVAIIGGLGNVRGAMVAATIVAFAETFGATYVSASWGPAFGLIAMLAVLMARPHGLFQGQRSEAEFVTQISTEARVTELRHSVHREHGERGDRAIRVVGSGLGVCCAVAIPLLLGGGEVLSLSASAMIFGVAAYGLWLTYRLMGFPNLLQAALLGVGSYTAGILSARHGLDFWAQLPAAVLVGAATGAVLGLIALRTRGHYFLIVTFALAEGCYYVFTNAHGLTGGVGGLIAPAGAGRLGPLDFSDLRWFYILTCACAAIACGVALIVVRSRMGKRLRAFRDDAELATALGMRALAYRVTLFGVSGALAGLAGWLYVSQQVAIEPSLFTPLVAVNFILVVLLGGNRNLIGPVVGAFVVQLLPELLPVGPNSVLIVYGALVVAIALFLPDGIAGGVERLRLIGVRAWYQRGRKRRMAGPTMREPRVERTAG